LSAARAETEIMNITQSLAGVLIVLAACNSELDQCQRNLQTAREANTRLSAQVQELSQSADNQWKALVSLDADNNDSNAGTIAEQLTAFLRQYPTDPRAKEARVLFSKWEKRREVADRVAKMDSITVEEIIANPQEFRSSIFKRRMCCDTVKLSPYGYESEIAELNWRAGNAYNASCFWRWKDDGPQLQYTSVNYDSLVEVRMDQRLAQAFAQAPKHREEGSRCKYIVDGTLYFAGQLDRKPVMYLKEALFAK
jgi:hypothetical protein